MIFFSSFFIASVHFFLILLKKSGIDKSTEWSTIPVCPSLMCFFDRGGTERTLFENFVFDVCVCFVLCKFVYRTDFVVFE